MEVRNCRKCRRLFNYAGGKQICPACVQELEKTFLMVKDYIREHEGIDINTVAEECKVDKNQITQWIREERLVLSSKSGAALSCESCGAAIYTGRFCEKCKANVASGLAQSISSPKAEAPKKDDKPGGPKMRFLH